MKKITLWLLCLCLFGMGAANAQVNPVKWKFTVEPVGEQEVVLVFSATVTGGYHLYGQHQDPLGPLPTVFVFPESADFKLKGKATESPKPVTEKDETFGVDVQFFKKDATFRQTITLASAKDMEIKGTIDYQVCNDETCVPFSDIPFSFKIKAVDLKNAAANVASNGAETSASVETETADATAETSVAETPEAEVATSTESENSASESLTGFILLAILAGLAAVFTPCVFPMIPMTVSFFIDSDQSGKGGRGTGIIKGAIFTGSITLIYTAIGAIVAATKSADFANVLSTHWIPNLIFFALFLVFAFSFFGLFEITLPTGLSNKMDAKADKGGYISAFFMAAVLAIVSFSCTGPFVAALLVEAAMGASMLKPLLGMFFFGLAMGLPFFLLSLFPSMLEKLPRSGGWLNSVKVVFAFVLLAFGMKFLLNIDQVYELHLFTREVYLAIWIVIFTLMGFYLLGKIKFSHDSDVPHIGVFRLLLVIVTFTFVVYLIPGLFGAPLKMVSALVPPTTVQQFDLSKSTAAVAVLPGEAGAGDDQVLCGTPKYADKLHLPFGLKGYFDYQEGLACAKEQNKPVFIDFKGHSCANCKKMEMEVWTDARVQALLKKYVIVALYCDDRTDLPESEWVTSTVDGNVKKTLGKRNADFEITKFKTNTLPFYHLLDVNGNPMVANSYGYNSDVEAFIAYLQSGLDAFNAK